MCGVIPAREWGGRAARPAALTHAGVTLAGDEELVLGELRVQLEEPGHSVEVVRRGGHVGGVAVAARLADARIAVAEPDPRRGLEHQEAPG